MSMLMINVSEFACGSENDINVYNLSNGKIVKTLQGHTALLRHLHITECLQYLFSGSDDKVLVK